MARSADLTIVATSAQDAAGQCHLDRITSLAHTTMLARIPCGSRAAAKAELDELAALADESVDVGLISELPDVRCVAAVHFEGAGGRTPFLVPRWTNTAQRLGVSWPVSLIFEKVPGAVVVRTLIYVKTSSDRRRKGREFGREFRARDRSTGAGFYRVDSAS
jgi:hypothetical protein